jgi:hypothetical protein
MKLLNKLKTVLLIALIAFACSGNKDQQASSNSSGSPSDTVAASEDVAATAPETGTFVGEYLIGDGNTYIVPVGDRYEMRDGTGKASDVFYFQGKENDTLSVYSNQDKSVTFKMNPAHKTGKYYADNEELPVELVGPVPEE